MEEKTNVMRILEQKKIAYQPQLRRCLDKTRKECLRLSLQLQNPGITMFLLFRWKRNWI